MLENIAIDIVNQSEGSLQLISYGLVVVGAIIAGVVTRSDATLPRAAYFAYSGLIFVALRLSEAIWLFTVPAMQGGYLSVLVILAFGAVILGGFLFGRIAMARSRDAYGHAKMAPLAFIPIANFWLLFTPSRQPSEHTLGNVGGVVLGIILVAAGVGATKVIEKNADRIVEDARSDPAAQLAGVDLMLRSSSLEETLRVLAAGARTPIVVDEVTTITKIEAIGTELRRTYVADLDAFVISDDFRARSTNGICAYPPFKPILEAGGLIREVYVKADGSPFGAIIVTRSQCGS